MVNFAIIQSKREHDQARWALYLEGAYISRIKQDKDDGKHFGIEIMTSAGGERDVRQLFASTLKDQNS